MARVLAAGFEPELFCTETESRKRATAREGSSIGVSKVTYPEQLEGAIALARHHDAEILAERWAPQVKESFVKRGTHQALDDIRESIAELQHYRQHFLKV